MPQQISPFLEANFGWNLGESGWNEGMDENLVKFSFHLDSNIDAVVDSLPSLSNGKAYYLTTDKRLYYVVNNTAYSSVIPKWKILKLRGTGQWLQYDGSGIVNISNTKELKASIDSLNSSFSSLGSAAQKATSDFVLAADASSTSDLTKGASLIGRNAQYVNSVSILKSLSKVLASKYAVTLGYYSAGDGGGCTYYLDLADNSSLDNGGSIIVAADGGRWKAVTNRPLTLRQWGCKGDNTTDDTARFLACVLAGQPFHVPAGNFKVGPVGPAASYPATALAEPNRTSAAVLSSGQTITGDGAGVSHLIWNSSTIQAFFLANNAKNVSISGIDFSGGYSPLIVDPISDGSVDNVGIRHCIVRNGLSGVIAGRQLTLDPASKFCSNIFMEHCLVRSPAYHGFTSSNCFGPRVIGNRFESVTNGFCTDFSQGTRGGILHNNQAVTMLHFAKCESSNTYVGGGTISSDPTVAESRDCSIQGNVATGIESLGVLLNSGVNGHIVKGNTFKGSISFGIQLGSVTGYSNAGQSEISNNIINMASVNAVGIYNQIDITTQPVLIDGNEIVGGSIGLQLASSRGKIRNNIITVANLGIQLAITPKELDITGNKITAAVAIQTTNAANGAASRFRFNGNDCTVSDYTAFLADFSSLNNSEFSGNSIYNATVRTATAVLIPNPRSTRFQNNSFNLVSGSGAALTTSGTITKSIVSGNISTTAFSFAGPDATTTSNTVNNIIDAVYVA